MSTRRLDAQLYCFGVTFCSNVQLVTHEFLMHLYHLDDVSTATAMVMLRRAILRLDTALYAHQYCFTVESDFLCVRMLGVVLIVYTPVIINMTIFYY